MAAERSSLGFRPHQRAFIERQVTVCRHAPGCIVDHELGSGKTLTVIGAVEALRRFPEFAEARVLVLTLKSLVEGFRAELARASQLCTTRTDLYTVQTVGQFYQRPIVEPGGVLIVDEAHLLRNPESKRYRSIHAAAQTARKTFLLTGTVMINYSVDVAALLNLVLADPDRPNYDEAAAAYAKIETECFRIKMPPPPRLRGYLPTTRKGWDQVAAGAESDVYLRCLVSHHREDHASLDYRRHFPHVERHLVKVSMTPAHYQAYQALARDQRPRSLPRKNKRRHRTEDHHLSGDEIRSFQERSQREPRLEDAGDVRFLAYMQHMRQACNYLKGADDVEYMPKLAHGLEHLVSRYQTRPSYKATVTTTFLAAGVHLVQGLLRRAGIPFATITGECRDAAEVQRAVDDFNNHKISVLVFSTAGQHGLNLLGAYDMFILNPHWNGGLGFQAEARGIRYDGHAGRPCDTDATGRPVVNVYYYLTVLPEKKGTTTTLTYTADEWLYKLSLLKAAENQPVLAKIATRCLETTERQYLSTHLPQFYKTGPAAPRVGEPAITTQISPAAGTPLRRSIPKRQREPTTLDHLE